MPTVDIGAVHFVALSEVQIERLIMRWQKDKVFEALRLEMAQALRMHDAAKLQGDIESERREVAETILTSRSSDEAHKAIAQNYLVEKKTAKPPRRDDFNNWCDGLNSIDKDQIARFEAIRGVHDILHANAANWREAENLWYKILAVLEDAKTGKTGRRVNRNPWGMYEAELNDMYLAVHNNSLSINEAAQRHACPQSDNRQKRLVALYNKRAALRN